MTSMESILDSGPARRSRTDWSRPAPAIARALFALLERLEHGMLTLVIPKAEEVKPRQIRISPVTEGAPAVAAEATKR